MLQGLVLLLVFQFAGELLADLLGVPNPFDDETGGAVPIPIVPEVCT